MVHGLIAALIESPDIPGGISDGLEGIIHDFPFFFIFVRATSSSVPIRRLLVFSGYVKPARCLIEKVTQIKAALLHFDLF
ncbi:MAG: hypothetical protein LBG24_05935 [Treponema sp.]|jgi:hypothetical protein|nr:hypothetical protein [Treponema sp.]